MTNEQYYGLIKPYEDARRILYTRIEILNHSLYGDKRSLGPVHNTQSRIKEKRSIEEKLRGMGLTDSASHAKDCLLDIAGMKLSPYYSYMLQLKEQIPILTAYGSYYDREGNLYSYDEDAGLAYARAVDNYFYLEYHNLQQNRDQKLYDPWP